MDSLTNGMKLVLLGAEVMTILCAVVVAFHPNILYASIFLLFAFLGVAAMFVYAAADFLAGAQVIIYVGGVTILVLFAIMLTQWLYEVHLRDIRNRIVVPAVICLLGLGPILYKVLASIWSQAPTGAPETIAKFSVSPKTAVIGQALLSTYLLPFEAVTVLLLGALVGAVWLARPES